MTNARRRGIPKSVDAPWHRLCWKTETQTGSPLAVKAGKFRKARRALPASHRWREILTQNPKKKNAPPAWPGPKFPFIAGSFHFASTRNTANFTPMIADEIIDLMHAEPFQPIRIVLGNEQSYVVTHTDYLAVSPDRQSMVLYDEQGHFRVINAQQIRLVEPVNRPSSKSG